MEFVETISLGELIVGAGTLILAVVTVIITAWQIKEARRVWHREVDRDYKRKLLDEFESWLQSVIRVLNEEAYCAKRWSKGSVEDYLNAKAELLEKLLHLSDPAFVLSEKARRPFEQYELKEKFDKLRDKYGDCTDMLHGIVERSTETKEEEEASCEIELLNMASDFSKYIIGIREEQKI